MTSKSDKTKNDINVLINPKKELDFLKLNSLAIEKLTNKK